jgi:transcriptional regulator of acetoin/glycerol metabolism
MTVLEPPATYAIDLSVQTLTDEVVRQLRAARAQYLGKGQMEGNVRAVVQNSWSRSARYGVPPDLRSVERFGTPHLEEWVRQAAAPVLRTLGDRLHRTRAVAIVTDAEGIIAELRGDDSVRRILEAVNILPGADISETASGTNAVGTAIEEGRGVQLCSGEHFIEAFQPVTCTAVPLRHPLTRRILAVLDLTTRDCDLSPAVAQQVQDAATAIERALVKRLTAREQALLFQYLKQLRMQNGAVIASNGQTTIMSADAAAFIQPADQTMLAALIAEGLRASRPFERSLTLASGETVQVLATPRFDGGEHIGVILRLKPLAAVRSEEVLAPPTGIFPGLVGRSAAFQTALCAAEAALKTRKPVCIVGAPGTGKHALARAMAIALHGRIAAIDCATVEARAKRWLDTLLHHLRTVDVLILLHIESLPPRARRALAALLTEQSDAAGARVIATARIPVRTSARAHAHGAMSDLCDVLATTTPIMMPSLAERREDIPLLVRAFLDRLETRRPLRLSAQAMQALMDAAWPGNVRQLQSVLHAAALTAHGSEIGPYDFPPELLRKPQRRLSRIEQAELDALQQALRETRGNRAKAAKLLGISRSTLYNKLRAYRSAGLLS